MAIKWFNIRTKEVRIARTEPQISAMWGSSDRGPNASQGQDFGWRLAPEVVVEMRAIKEDFNKLLEIANRFRKPVEDVGEKEILAYISSKTAAEKAPVADDADYTEEYHDQIRRLEQKRKAERVPPAESLLEEPPAPEEPADNPPEAPAEEPTTETATTTEKKPAPKPTTTKPKTGSGK